MKYIAALAALILIGVSGIASAGDPGRRAEIVTVITSQLDAIARKDGATAFALATPEIRAMFGTPERFMAMVLQQYTPLYRPRAITFLDVIDSPQGPIQRVLLTGAGGEQVTALYTMLRMKDGLWNIAGCVLLRQSGGAA